MKKRAFAFGTVFIDNRSDAKNSRNSCQERAYSLPGFTTLGRVVWQVVPVLSSPQSLLQPPAGAVHAKPLSGFCTEPYFGIPNRRLAADIRNRSREYPTVAGPTGAKANCS